jgi:hypothetical protein
MGRVPGWACGHASQPTHFPREGKGLSLIGERLSTGVPYGVGARRKVWDELHLGKKRLGLGDLPRGKLPKPAYSLLVQWRQRFLASQLREEYAIQEHIQYKGVLVLYAALGLGAPLHLRRYDKQHIYIPRYGTWPFHRPACGPARIKGGNRSTWSDIYTGEEVGRRASARSLWREGTTRITDPPPR